MKGFIKDKFPQLFKLAKRLKGVDYNLLIGLPKIKNSDFKTPVISLEEGNNFIYNQLISDKPCFITRYGSAELSAIVNYLFLKKGKVSSWDLQKINGGLFRMNALFPATINTLNQFVELYLQSSKSIDALAVWYNFGEHLLHKDIFPNGTLFPIESLEPFRFTNPWSYALYGKKVLIVLPFEQSIIKQYEKRNLLFSNRKVLTDFELKAYKPFNSYTDKPALGKDWFYYLSKMEEDIALIDFDVALIAAGPFGLPLAASVKKSGRKAVHVGGALQLLFGIKGNRWEERPEFVAYMNEYWIKPAANEIPVQEIKSKIDNSSYW
ncbi:MAG TPA: hypothetical protein VFN30_15485 [Chitinophagaceae bacterium]|nr:hypothetical protein [Chitinophagaceae bacterium]